MKNLLLVGTGSIGRRHISNFQNLFDNIDIVDISQDRIDEAKSQFKIRNTFLDYSLALNNEKYDAVAITAPPHVHLPIAKLAAEKNANLFIEKPLGMNINGWDEVIKICENNNLISYVAFCHRHIPYTRRVKEILDSEKYGKILHAVVRWGSYLPDWHPWEDYRSFYMAKKEQGGGALLDESHGIDLVRYLIGEPKNIFAKVRNLSDLELTSDDTAFLLMELNNGPLAHINFDLTSRNPRVSIEIVCSEGTILWDRVEHRIELFDAKNNEWKNEEYTKDDFLSMYPIQAKHFYDSIYNNKDQEIDISDGLKTQKIIDAAFKSSSDKLLVEI